MTEHDYLFARLSPEMKAYTDTEQFKLSERILDIRYDNQYMIEDILEATGLTLNEYADLEFGRSTVSVQVYKDAIEALENYKK